MNLHAAAEGATLSNGMIKTPTSSTCDAVVSDTYKAVDMMDISGFQRPKRSLPALVGRIKAFLARYWALASADHDPHDRLPKGCVGLYIAEIGLKGRATGKDILYLGGRFQALRLNKLVMENIDEPAILDLLGAAIEPFSRERLRVTGSATSPSVAVMPPRSRKADIQRLNGLRIGIGKADRSADSKR